jgi:hypothetical protein
MLLDLLGLDRLTVYMDPLKKLVATLVGKLFLEIRYLLRNRYYIDYTARLLVALTHKVNLRKVAPFGIALLGGMFFEHNHKSARKVV